MADAANEHRHPDDQAERPPKPYLTLRVGISGHRPKPKTFPKSAFDRVQRQLRDVFITVDRSLVELKPTIREFYYAPATKDRDGRDTVGEPPHRVRLVSALAEGADQMAVNARLPHWDVEAVLPFPKESYRRDFKQSAIDNRTDVSQDFDRALEHATTVVELPEDARVEHFELTEQNDAEQLWAVRKQAYARLGTFLLGQIDILVAVWDGEPEEGAGGTGEVVRGALDAGIPVVWISTMAPLPPRMIKQIDENSHPVAPPADALQGPLKDAISIVVSKPRANAYDASQVRAPDG